MNIIYVTPLFPQQRVVKYVGTLIQEGHEVTVLTFDLDSNKTQLFKKIDNNNLKIISLNLKGKLKLLPFKYILLSMKFKELTKTKFDIVIFRDIFTYDIASSLKKSHGSKLIMDVADNYPEVILTRFNKGIFKKISYWILNKLERKAVRNSSIIFTVTENSRKLIINKHNVSNKNVRILKNYPMKEDIIYNGGVTNNTRNNKIVYIGTVDQKVRNISEVLAFLKDSNYKMDIYSFNKQVVLKLIEENNAQSVAFYKNPVNRKELVKVLKNYSIGIIPHRIIEGTKYTIPNKLYDYIHSSLLVVASNNTAMAAEILKLGIGEIYVSKHDFLRKIKYLLEHPNEYYSNLESARSNCIWENQQSILLEAIRK